MAADTNTEHLEMMSKQVRVRDYIFEMETSMNVGNVLDIGMQI